MESRDRSRRHSGRLGEALAAWFLERRGYRVRERNLRIGRYEIDLVVEQARRLVFVEVKYRGPSSWAGPRETLAPSQRARLAAAAAAYAARLGEDRDIRFDVVVIEESDDRLVVEHLLDALGVGGGPR